MVRQIGVRSGLAWQARRSRALSGQALCGFAGASRLGPANRGPARLSTVGLGGAKLGRRGLVRRIWVRFCLAGKAEYGGHVLAGHGSAGGAWQFISQRVLFWHGRLGRALQVMAQLGRRGSSFHGESFFGGAGIALHYTACRTLAWQALWGWSG
jgi:hypothetical protein